MRRWSAAIIDTNVVVAGLLTSRTDSPGVRIVDGMIAATFPFTLSDALLAEYRTVMTRPKLRALHGLDEEQIDTILLEFAQHAIVMQPSPAPSKAPDPDDQHLWDLLAARDDLLLVSGDRRLHGVGDMASRVVMPEAFIELIETR